MRRARIASGAESFAYGGHWPCKPPAPRVERVPFVAMPSYRLIFPTSPDMTIENTHTAVIESDTFYEVGAELRHGGKLWRVSSAPVEQPTRGEIADLMVWPAE